MGVYLILGGWPCVGELLQSTKMCDLGLGYAAVVEVVVGVEQQKWLHRLHAVAIILTVSAYLCVA